MVNIQGSSNKDLFSNVQHTDLQPIVKQKVIKKTFGFAFTQLPSLSGIKNFFLSLLSLAKPPLKESSLNSKKVSLQQKKDDPVITKIENLRHKSLKQSGSSADLAGVIEWQHNDIEPVIEKDLSGMSPELLSDLNELRAYLTSKTETVIEKDLSGSIPQLSSKPETSSEKVSINTEMFKSAFMNALNVSKRSKKEKFLKEGFAEIDKTIAKIKMLEAKMQGVPTVQEKADFTAALESLNNMVMEIRHSKDPVIVAGVKEHKKIMDAQLSNAVLFLSNMSILYS